MSEIKLKNPQELALMRQSGKLLAQVFAYLDLHIKAGLSTMQINDLTERYIVDQLAARPVEDPWHHVGRAVLLVSRGDFEGALASANQAVAVGAAVPEAHYQLGLVLAGRREFPAAAAAFDAAAERDPSYAYAFYQAGLAYYRHRRIDVMAARYCSRARSG